MQTARGWKKAQWIAKDGGVKRKEKDADSEGMRINNAIGRTAIVLALFPTCRHTSVNIKATVLTHCYCVDTASTVSTLGVLASLALR